MYVGVEYLGMHHAPIPFVSYPPTAIPILFIGTWQITSCGPPAPFKSIYLNMRLFDEIFGLECM